MTKFRKGLFLTGQMPYAFVNLRQAFPFVGKTHFIFSGLSAFKTAMSNCTGTFLKNIYSGACLNRNSGAVFNIFFW